MLELNKIHQGDCLELMKDMEDNSVDSIVTDPPYGLSFMGKKWDYDVPSVEIWKECLRVLKPGGYLLSFAGTRTQHRMAVSIEDAGFEIRDMIAWVYGSGFPKSHNIGKAIDKISKRLDLFQPFAEHYEKQRKSKKLTHNEICEIGKFYNNHNHGGASSNWSIGANVPTLKQWEILKPLLNLSDDFKPLIDRIEAEREVIERKRIQRNSASWETNKGMLATGEQNFDITAPATEEAKKWEGWGTALKPALEPITVARKPFKGTVANNVLKWGTGGINIDGCRVEFQSVEDKAESTGKNKHAEYKNSIVRNSAKNGIYHADNRPPENYEPQGRFPANFCHDGSDEVVGLFPDSKGSGNARTLKRSAKPNQVGWGMNKNEADNTKLQDAGSGSAARFFYCAKASKKDRNEGCEGLDEKHIRRDDGQPYGMNTNKFRPDGTERKEVPPKKNNHPTVKPVKLMQYLVRLVTPKNGICLDPFIGSGSTAKACIKEGFNYMGIELDKEYVKIAQQRIKEVAGCKAEGDDGIPPTNKLVGILPKRL